MRAGDLLERRIEVMQERVDARQQMRSRFRQRHAARRAVQEARTEVVLQAADRMAEGRGRHPQQIGGAPEAVVFGDSQEGAQVGQGRFAHY